MTEINYELHLSSPPDDLLIQKYKKHVAPIKELNLTKHSQENLLFGSHKFDQNIEEEWLIIYLLYELSKFDHDLVIKVHDDDGEILLIEAAEHLPRWLESSKSKNRVFIHAGKLHIIPEHIKLKDLQSVTKFIRDMNKPNSCPMVRTEAEPAIQEAISEQLSGMPDTKAWLSKKYKQLDEIITENSSQETKKLHTKFKESLSLTAVMAMNDEDLKTSPISTMSSSFASSSSWLTELDDN